MTDKLLSTIIKPNNIYKERSQYPIIFSDLNLINDHCNYSSSPKMMQSNNKHRMDNQRKSPRANTKTLKKMIPPNKKINDCLKDHLKEKNDDKPLDSKYDIPPSPRPLLKQLTSSKGNDCHQTKRVKRTSDTGIEFVRNNIEKRKKFRSNNLKQQESIANQSEQQTKQSHFIIGRAFSPTPYTPERPVLGPIQQNNFISHYDKNLFLLPFLSINPSLFNMENKHQIVDFNSLEERYIDNIKKSYEITKLPFKLETLLKNGMKLRYGSISRYKMDNLALITINTFAQIMQAVFQPKPEQKSQSEFLLTMVYKNQIDEDDENFSYSFVHEIFKCKRTLDLVFEQHHFLNYIVIIGSKMGDNNAKQNESYVGFINDVEIEYRNNGQWLRYEIMRYNNNKNNDKSTKLSLEDDQWLIKPLFYLRPSLRLFETLTYLESHRANLFKSLIELDTELCCFQTSLNELHVKSFQLCDTHRYTVQQQNIIMSSLKMMMLPHIKFRMLMIQGPPGTGKTHTLLGIVKNILSNLMDKNTTPKYPLRIMICAPSNGAIDAIGLRLLEEKDTFLPNGRPLRMVRIGQPRDIHTDMLPYEIESLTNYNFGKIRTDYLNSLKNPDNNEKDKKFPKFEKRTNVRDRLICDADIILTTLASSQHSSLNMFRSHSTSFNYSKMAIRCLIIDEASQCSEPEFLMPFLYESITKVIMIGDPLQLPATVISRCAHRAGYGRSFLERFYLHLQQSNSDEHAPLIMRLTKQFRMHKEICSFPSKHFYESTLLTATNSGYNPNINFHPYFVFNITDSKESSSNQSKLNAFEVKFICKLLIEILNKIDCNNNNSENRPAISIGVITYYREQKRAIKEGLKNKIPDKWLEHIQIETVDAFQGRECDIIILSCVRAYNTNHQKGSIGFVRDQQRMNVALTRARSSLFICLHNESFKNNPRWKDLLSDANNRKRLFNVVSNTRNTELKLLLK